MLQTGSPSSEKTKMDDQEIRNEVIVLAFYGTSCMGKSELVRFIKERSAEDRVHVQDISKDVVAKPLMDAYHQANPDVLYENVYMTILTDILETYCTETFRALSNLKPGKNIVVLDDAWADSKLVQKILDENVSPGYSKKVICVYPKVSKKRMYMDLPFSLQFIVNLIYRVIGRKEHETMVYEDIKKVQIVLSFLKLYSGIQDIPSKFSDELPANIYTPLEFHQEDDEPLVESELPVEISMIFQQVSKCFNTMGAPFESPFVTGKDNFAVLTGMMAKLIDEQAHARLPRYINYARLSEWRIWYDACLL